MTTTDRPLRIMLVVDSLSLGGAERVALDLCTGLLERGCRVWIAHVGTVHDNPLVAEFRQLGIVPIDLAARHIADVGALVRLLSAIRRHDIDVLHTHLIYADVLGRVASRLARVPVVSTVHNVLAGIQRAPRHRYWLEVVTARLMCDQVAVVTERTKGELERAWGLSPNRTSHVPNGVALDRWLEVPAKAAEPRFRMINVASLTRQKDQRTLLRAVDILRTSHEDVSCSIVGQGPLASDLQAFARELGLGSHVEFLGSTPDVASRMADADVFVLTSSWEGMPISAIEAAAAGRPAVVTDVGANAEIVEHGVTGWVVPPGDPAAVASALSRLAADPDHRARMGRAARTRAVERFSHQRMLDRYLELYAQTLARRRGRPSWRRAPGRVGGGVEGRG